MQVPLTRPAGGCTRSAAPSTRTRCAHHAHACSSACRHQHGQLRYSAVHCRARARMSACWLQLTASRWHTRMQVILNGSQSMHAVGDAGVSVASADGAEVLRIKTPDAALVSPGEWGVAAAAAAACLRACMWGCRAALLPARATDKQTRSLHMQARPRRFRMASMHRAWQMACTSTSSTTFGVSWMLCMQQPPAVLAPTYSAPTVLTCRCCPAVAGNAPNALRHQLPAVGAVRCQRCVAGVQVCHQRRAAAAAITARACCGGCGAGPRGCQLTAVRCDI